MYQLAGNYIKRLSDGVFIPQIESNQDYSEYLLWRDGRPETGVPEKIDEDGTVIKEAHILPELDPHKPLPEDENQYQSNRQAEYPGIGEQLDYIFHHGLAKWKTDMIQPIKDKYPKTEKIIPE